MDLSLQFPYIYSFLFHDLEHRLQGSLVTDSHIILILVEDKLFTLLVDCVIGEMHADIVDVVFIGRYVCFSGESAEALAEDENAKRVDSSDQDIDSEVELQAVDQVRPT